MGLGNFIARTVFRGLGGKITAQASREGAEEAAQKGPGFFRRHWGKLTTGGLGLGILGGGATANALKNSNSEGGFFGWAQSLLEGARTTGARAGWEVIKEKLYAGLETLGTIIADITGGEFGVGLANFAREAQGLERGAWAAGKGVHPNNGEAPIVGGPTGPSGPGGGTPDVQEAGFFEKAADFGEGLITEATDLENYSVKGAFNLAHSAGHGVTQGVGLIGSFAYANTIGWFTGQSTSEIQKNYVSTAIDTAWEATGAGLPDLSSHWAQAVNVGGEFAAPAGALAKVGRALSNAFGLANSTTSVGKVADLTTRTAPQVTLG